MASFGDRGAGGRLSTISRMTRGPRQDGWRFSAVGASDWNDLLALGWKWQSLVRDSEAGYGHGVRAPGVAHFRSSLRVPLLERCAHLALDRNLSPQPLDFGGGFAKALRLSASSASRAGLPAQTRGALGGHGVGQQPLSHPIIAAG